MAYKTLPVNIAGPSYQDRSKPLASQQTKNFYHEVVESGKDQYVIKSFPGQKLFGSTVAGIDRGQHQMLEVNYRVVANTLFKVLSDGTHQALGSIPGSERCIFADDGINLFIVADLIVSQYNGADVTLVADADIQGALSVAYINNQFAYTKPLLTVFSDVGNGASGTSLNAVGAEANPDDLVRDYTFDEILYRFGTRSLESWYNSGVGTPPFDKLQGQLISMGLSAKHSVSNTRGFIYWLGTDKQIYRARGGQEQPISTASIAGAIQGYSVVGDCFSEVFTVDNKTFVMFTFPTANKTWVLNEELGVNGWFELSEGVTAGSGEDAQYNGASISEVYGKVLVGDRLNGKLYELDFDTLTQGGEEWQRRRVLASINGDLVGAKGKRVQMSRFELILETGVGLISGQGSDPKIMIEYSKDGGRTWKQGTWMRIGRLGEYNVRGEWFGLDSFYDMIIRITTTDPVPFNIYSAAIDLRLAGR